MSSGDDPLSQRLRLIGKVTAAFKRRGYDLIVVGGSALEFYTEGGYVSGDVDLCRALGQRPITPIVEKEVMLSLGAESTGTRRQWKIGDTFVDLLGEIETARSPNFRTVQTPDGPIRLMPAEDILVERAFIAYARGPQQPDRDALVAAKQMAAVAMKMPDFDWDKALALAASSDYQIGEVLRTLKTEAAKTSTP